MKRERFTGRGGDKEGLFGGFWSSQTNSPPPFLLPSLFISLLSIGCGWNPSRPFDREAPPVQEAIRDFDAGDAGAAVSRLEEYLSTGVCKDGSIGTPDIVKRRPDGTFDLGLSLFRIGEQFGRRFGDEEIDAGVSQDMREQRHAQVECARRLADVVGSDPSARVDLRARALYLEGNLAFLDGAYEDAVRAYDQALVLVPGMVDAGDAVGRDAAWNRAIALRRIEDRKDAGQDASQDASQDAPSDGPSEGGGKDAAGDSGGGGQDASRGKEDAGQDSSQPSEHPDAAPPPPPPDAGGPPPPPSNEDERMLDQLESAPTLQQEEARRGTKRHVRWMADK
jgi:hypothetical protein